jgi:hypothetical protein
MYVFGQAWTQRIQGRLGAAGQVQLAQDILSLVSSLTSVRNALTFLL